MNLMSGLICFENVQFCKLFLSLSLNKFSGTVYKPCRNIVLNIDKINTGGEKHCSEKYPFTHHTTFLSKTTGTVRVKEKQVCIQMLTITSSTFSHKPNCQKPHSTKFHNNPTLAMQEVIWIITLKS